MKLTRVFFLSWLTLALCCGTSQAFISNGDFEADPFDTDWTNDGTILAESGTGLIPGSTTAASLPGADAGVRLFQRTTDGSQFLRNFDLDFYFQIDGPMGSNRSLNMQLRYAGSQAGEGVNARINGAGDLEVFTGSWEPVPGAGAAFESDEVYRLQVQGRGWGESTASPSLAFLWSDAGGSALSNMSGDMSVLNNGGFRFLPEGTTGAGNERALSEVRFLTQFQSTDDPGYRIDELTLTAAVPEPGTGLLGLIGMVVVSLMRRRK